jgi:hypothetical protein
MTVVKKTSGQERKTSTTVLWPKIMAERIAVTKLGRNRSNLRSLWTMQIPMVKTLGMSNGVATHQEMELICIRPKRTAAIAAGLKI